MFLCEYSKRAILEGSIPSEVPQARAIVHNHLTKPLLELLHNTVISPSCATCSSALVLREASDLGSVCN
jgi:hypothetical protein